mgnify:CR=1 FL=1
MLRPHWLASLLLIASLATLAGCAHKQAIDRANSYAQKGDWRAAYAQCQKALELNPDSAEAQECAADTRPRATAAALEDARKALRARDYAGALDHLEYIDTIHEERPPKAETLRGDVRRAVRERLQGYIADKEMERAYKFAVTASGIYANADFVQDAFSTCRNHFLERAESLRGEQKFAAAIEALEPIKTHEAGQRGEIQQLQGEIRSEWARDLEARAEAFEADDKLAGATVYYAKAYELAGHERARIQLQRLTQQISATTQYGVDWKMDGPRDWTKSFQASLTARLQDGVVRNTDTPKVLMEFDLTASNCSDEATDTTQASQEYVSGTRRVQNPEWEKIDDELADARDSLEDARQDESELAHAASRAEREVDDYRVDVIGPTRQKLESARSRERNLAAQVQPQQLMLDNAEDKLRRLERDPNSSEEAIADQQMTVETLEDNLRVKETQLAVAKRKRRALEREFEDARDEFEDLKDERERLLGLYAEAKRERRAIEDDIDALESDLRSTPRTVEEDVIDTFEYEVVSWKRTCKTDVDVDVQLVDPEKEYTTSIEGRASTTDSSHQAYPRYGVERDPLEFPTDDLELLDKVDQHLADEAFKVMYSSARKYWNRTISEAVGAMSDKPHFAAELLLSVYLTAPKHLDSGQVTALREHLLEHYEYSPLEIVAEN